MIPALLGGLGQMLGHDFMRHAFLAGTLVAAAAGPMGCFVVMRNQVFAADSLGHVAFTGALAALAAGVEPLLGLFGATLAGALAMAALGGRWHGRDVVIGTVHAWVLGVGVLCLSLYTASRSAGHGAAGISVMFGSMLGLSQAQAVGVALTAAAVGLALLMIARPLLFASLDPEVAAARGLPVRALDLAFMALVAVCVAEAVQAIGALLIFALLVMPAACALRLTARPLAALGLSAAVGVAAVWGGLTLSYALGGLPPSSLIVALAFGAQLSAAAGQAVRRIRRVDGRLAWRRLA